MSVAYGHRGATDLSGPTPSISRARRGHGCLRRGRGMLGKRSSEAGVSNAIEQLLLHGGNGVPCEGWQ